MPAWILPTHEPLQTQPGAAGLAQTQPCPKAAKAPAGANNTRVCKGVLHTEIQIPDALQWEGTFMLCFNLNVSTAQSDELTAQVCPAPGQHMLKWVLSPISCQQDRGTQDHPFPHVSLGRQARCYTTWEPCPTPALAAALLPAHQGSRSSAEWSWGSE